MVAFFVSTSLLAPAAPAAEPMTSQHKRAFPGAEGWAATTPAGRGGRIIRVTTLEAEGPGSLLEALAAKGPRIVVFEVGGVIDLGGKWISIKQPFLTIAGQTAPSPGITLIRGGLQLRTHDVVIRHLRFRPGEAGRAKKSGWDVDGISSADGTVDAIIDHCSFSWATDENLDVWGEPFLGATPEDWHRNNPQRITYSNNIIAEGLNDSTNTKGPHSKGVLIGDNTTYILLVGNLFADNVQRNPQIKGGVWSAVVNNYIYNPVTTSVHYHMTDLWKGRPYTHGKLELVGNVMRHGPDTLKDLALFRFGGCGDLELHADDNLCFDRAGKPLAIVYEDKRYGGKILPESKRFFWPEGLVALPASQVQEHVLQNAGARPWDRDAIDERIIRQTRVGTGRIIDSEQDVGGYPTPPETRASFDPAQWDLSTMERK
jgi:hypothetical protein